MTKNTEPQIGRFANVLLDHWFKRTFVGEDDRKQLLILFLNELIPEREITDLTYTSQEGINPFPDKKGICIDVECTDSCGRRFVVEMQRAVQDDFFDRAVFYSTFAVQKQIDTGEDDYTFPPVYFIGILDFVLHTDDERFCFRYRLREDLTPKRVMTENLQFVFLELPKCTMRDEAGVLEKFGYALHNLYTWEERPEGLEGEIFRLLLKWTEITKFADEEKEQYLHDMTTERDIRNQIKYAHKEGKAEGRAEGLAEGKAEGAREEKLSIARAMLAQGEPVDKIALYTGLSAEELQQLK